MIQSSVIEREGWLFDYYPLGDQMVLWFLLDADGERLRLTQAFAPRILVEAKDPAHLRDFLRSAARTRSFRPTEPVVRRDFWTGAQQPLIALSVIDLDHAHRELMDLYRKHPRLSYYDCDIPFEQFYAYQHDLFPTARCRIRYVGDTLLEIHTLDRTGDTDYPAMPLRTARLEGDAVLGAGRSTLRWLALEAGDQRIEWDGDDPVEVLESLNRTLEEWDPDLILSRGGDSVLMPCLFQIAARTGVTLRLDREPGIERRIVVDGSTYQSYGRIVYRDPDHPLWGRWHIDLRNSFLAYESDLDGLMEASRVSRLPVQRMARRSIGTGISSVQMAFVSQRGYPIPWKKTRPEDWKTALQLIRTDRGGLTYAPRPGVFENVIELDFISMYPSIMTNFNVSPETVNCGCCPESRFRVPELGYRLCEKRTGMISQSLQTILDKRIEYKRRMKKTDDPAEYKRFKDRQTALKWLLVTCFGYLGYRNARFGRIEAHESICAFSREMLLRTREICEARGFRLLHSLVDCVWVERRGQTDAEIESVCREIEENTNLPIAIEGHYSWLVLLSSTLHPDLPVPAKYFGRFSDGSLKFRGIELRRSDQAAFVQEIQGQLLDQLSKADSAAACRALREELLATVTEARRKLVDREVHLNDLVLKRKLSRSAEEYTSSAITATAARQAARIGKHLIGGQEVYFVVTDSKSGNPDERIKLVEYLHPETDYDVDFYLEQLRRAVRTVLLPFITDLDGKPKRATYQEMLFEI